jgi:hypothetical protein
VLSRFFLEIYTDNAPVSVWIFSLFLVIPLSSYAAVRTVAVKKEKWYGTIGYFVIYTAMWLLSSNYIIVNGDLLISCGIKRRIHTDAVVTDVRKVFYKSGFDHTAVTLKIEERLIVLQGRPYVYFYLAGKEQISTSYARSFLGNTFISTDAIPTREKFRARWMHFKDQVYRLRVFAGVILSIILIGFLWPGRKLATTQRVSAKMGFWKMMGIVMGILLILAMLFYIGIFVYVKFFAH